MTLSELQDRCERGQLELVQMEYLRAEKTLSQAEQEAWDVRDWDTLSRLYLPLQEARRQRRQRCGEGTVWLDVVSRGPDDPIDADSLASRYPHGQFLAAGWGSIAPGRRLRSLQQERGLYLDAFLGAAYPTEEAMVVVIIPLDNARLPPPVVRPLRELVQLVPPHSVILRDNELPKGPRPGTAQSYGEVMALWERLHAPFLQRADAEPDLTRRMDLYRGVIQIDYACELAHQKLGDVARELSRRM